MRFSLVNAAILSLVASAVAQNNRPSAGTEFTGGHRRLRCRHVNRVSWKRFSFEKKIAKLVLEDASGNVLQQQDVNAQDGYADFAVPETSDRIVKLLLIDIETNAVFAQGEDISIDCPRNNDFDATGRVGREEPVERNGPAGRESRNGRHEREDPVERNGRAEREHEHRKGHEGREGRNDRNGREEIREGRDSRRGRSGRAGRDGRRDD